jgi:aryl-alcohol dehydrogenase-like predicted oxidoreductase
LQVDCVDIYYVHNPETQLAEVPRAAFMARLRAAFAQLEEAGAAGQLRMYGVATWNGLRQPQSAGEHLSLQALVRLAEEVGGKEHRFRVIQAPFNVAMPEALIRATQRVDGEALSLLAAAERLGITVVASAAILQGQLSRRLRPGLSEVFPDLRTNAQRAIQFARSAPGLTATLVGMKQVAHVQENLATARVAPASAAQFRRLFAEAHSES